jgi:hypothetical protein
LIGSDFKGLDYEGMWNLREKKYKETGVFYYKEIVDKLKQYKWKEI